MRAEILRWTPNPSTDDEEVGTGGHWETYQDPYTGEFYNKWIPDTTPDNPSTPENESKAITVPCSARGIISRAAQSGGTKEEFGDMYLGVDAVRMTLPARINISKRDRVTNIREARTGKVVWQEDGKPVIFNVDGVVPLFDPFNKHIENFVVLERVE